MKKSFIVIIILTTLISLGVGWVLGEKFGFAPFQGDSIVSPLVEKARDKRQPLLKYTFKNLQNYPYQASRIVIERVIVEEPEYTSYVFSYRTLDKTMTGQLNIPQTPAPINGYPVIVMIRGWAPAETYVTGTGTKPAAAVFARHGYVTIAPDFFGYGGSDPELDDNWEARFQKPVNAIELLKTIQAESSILVDNQSIKFDGQRLALWAHSNGGQITLATLEILQQPIPTTLWAPVTAPFPYSVLFFTDEDDDEGKQFRKHLANFEENYDVFEYSLTQHLDQLTGPIQIHQGTADEAVLPTWNQEFADKVDQENARRAKLIEEIEAATEPATLEQPILPPIDLTLFIYPGADHNLRPGWDVVVQRDLQFFAKQL